MEASGGYGQGGLLVQESNEAPQNGMRGLTECSSRDETDGVGVQVEPEVVLPAQVFDRRADLLQPEKRLMLAILRGRHRDASQAPDPSPRGKTAGAERDGGLARLARHRIALRIHTDM